MIRGDRIKARLDAIGKSQADLARAVQLSPQAIGKLVRGGTNETGKLYQIARFLRTTPEFLTGEIDLPEQDAIADRRLVFHGAEPELVPGMVEIEHVDLRFGLGGTYLDGHVETAKLSFPRNWLRGFTDIAPAKLVWTSGVGDSMYPTIQDGDPLLIDISRTTLDEIDGIWACAIGEVGMIKRLRPRPDGTIEIHSDNKEVPTAVAADGELHVIGRVIRKIGRL